MDLRTAGICSSSFSNLIPWRLAIMGGSCALGVDDGGFGQTARFVGFGFGDAGGLGNIGIGKAFGLGGGRGAGGLGFELEFRGVGERLDPVAFGVGGLLDVGFEFALLAH